MNATLAPTTKVSADGRSITTSWILEGMDTRDQYGDTWRPRLDLTTSHNKDRRQFETRYARVTVSPTVVNWVFDGSHDPAPVRTYADPVARFNAKQLRTVHEAEVATAEAHLAELIEWAERVDFRV